MSIATPERRLTVAEVTEIEGVDEKTVRDWIMNGELRAVDVSRNRGVKPRWRIAPADLEAFEQRRSNTVGVTTKPERQRKPKRPDGWVEYV